MDILHHFLAVIFNLPRFNASISDASMMVFSGNANLVLSKDIARRLSMRLGMALTAWRQPII
jgi:hypothetical protein